MSTNTSRNPLRRALAVGLAALGALSAGAPLPASAAAPAGKPAHSRARPPSAQIRPAPAAQADAPPELALPIERVTLANGLRVVMSVDRSSPTVAVAMTYDAGSRHEPSGRSGVAHLVMRMLSRGSQNVPPGGAPRLVAERGGELDAVTGPDCTVYTEVLPASELALALWLEADRMRAPDLSAQSFEDQRREAEARRGALLASAYGDGAIRLGQLVFQGYWPYEHPVLGEEADLDAAQLSWAREFHAAHYGPNKAVLSLAGDFDPGEAMALVRKYFDAIPSVPGAPLRDATFPEQTSQRTAVVRDSAVRVPEILYGWAVPPRGHADHPALELAAFVLGGGESSRLTDLLVRDKAVAQRVRVVKGGRRGPDLFSIDVRLAGRARVGDVEKLIEGEIRELATRGPSQAELARARRLFQSAFVAGLSGASARARALGEHELLFGDATGVRRELARYAAVTPEDVKRAVREHLGPTRRTIVETYPPSAAELVAPRPARRAGPAAAGGGARSAAPAEKGGAKAAAPAAPRKGPSKVRTAAPKSAPKSTPAPKAAPAPKKKPASKPKKK